MPTKARFLERPKSGKELTAAYSIRIKATHTVRTATGRSPSSKKRSQENSRRSRQLQLNRAPGADRKAVDALISKIQMEMLTKGASLTLCRYSDEPFNTNEMIWPHWSEIPFHPPTAGLALATLLAIGVAVWSAWPRRSVRSTTS